MRTISADHEALLTKAGKRVLHRVKVKDGSGAFRDLSTYVVGISLVVTASWKEDVDSNGYVADVQLRRSYEMMSINPLMENSPLNRGFNISAAYAPLLDIGREIRIEWAICPLDSAPTTWNEGFGGYIDSVSLESDPITLSCRDRSARIIDSFIERERVYNYAQTTSGVKPDRGAFVWEADRYYNVGDLLIPTQGKLNGFVYKTTVAGPSSGTEPTWPTSLATTVSDGAATHRCEFNASTTAGTTLENALAQLLLDALPAGAPVILTPSTPSWNIRWYFQQRDAAFTAARVLAEQIGWDLRYKWYNDENQFRLTLWSPDRNKTVVDRVFSQYDGPRRGGVKLLELNIANIRNVVRVIYSDYNDKHPDGTPKRKVVDATNATSILSYGRRFMEIAESSTSNIDTSTEANTLANAVLSDLATPSADYRVEIPFFPFAELGDLYQFPADDVHFSTAQKFAVVAVAHTISVGGKATTTLDLRGKVSGGYRKWLERDTRADRGDTHAITNVSAPSLTVTPTPIVGGTRIKTSIEPTLASRPNMIFEHHFGSTSNFSPSGSTLASVTAGRDIVVPDQVPGATLYHKVIPIWFNAGRVVRGQPTAGVAVTAGRGSAGHLKSEVRWGRMPLNGGFETQTDTNAPPDFWSVVTGTWGTHFVLMNDTNGVTGTNYIKIDNVSSAYVMKSALVDVEGGASYMFEMWAKVASGTGQINLNVLEYDYNFGLIGSATQITGGSSSTLSTWKRIGGGLALNASTRYVAITVDTTGANALTAYFDSVAMERNSTGSYEYSTTSLGSNTTTSSTFATIVTRTDFTQAVPGRAMAWHLAMTCFSSGTATIVEVRLKLTFQSGSTINTNPTLFYFNNANEHNTIAGHWVTGGDSIVSSAVQVEVQWRRVSGSGTITTDANDSLSLVQSN